MDKRLNLSQIAELMAAKSGMSKANAERFVKSFFDIIVDNAAKGETVKIKGLGTFKTIMVDDRESIRVNTGERFVIPGYKKVNFIPDATLKEEINKPFSAFETLVLSDSQAAALDAMDNHIPETAEKVTETAPVAAGSAVPENKRKTANNKKKEKTAKPVQDSVPEGPKVKEITQKRWVRIVLKLLIWILSLLLILLVLAILLWPLAGRKLFSRLDKAIDNMEMVDREYQQTPVFTVENDNDEDPVIQAEVIQAEPSAQVTFTEPKPVVTEPKPAVQESKPSSLEPEPVVKPQTVAPESKAVSNVTRFHLSAADESKDLGLFTAADTVNYRMTGTMTVHQVKEGETLTQISLAEYGTKKLWPYIAAYNNMQNSNALNAGSRILIPSIEAR